MKTAVITGSARGLGFEMSKVFLNNNVNVVISDVNEENLKKAKENLESISKNASVEACKCNVTNTEDIENLIKFAKEKFSKIDIWINNAGVNQPEKAIWELTEEEINIILDVDLKGTINATRLIMKEM